MTSTTTTTIVMTLGLTAALIGGGLLAVATPAEAAVFRVGAGCDQTNGSIGADCEVWICEKDDFAPDLGRCTGLND